MSWSMVVEHLIDSRDRASNVTLYCYGYAYDLCFATLYT